MWLSKDIAQAYVTVHLSAHNCPEVAGRWSKEGCRLLQETPTEVICACDQLSSFALILVSDQRT